MVTAEVKFYVEFDEDNMPSSYTNTEYLIEVIQEAVTDAMYDVGADLVNVPRVELDQTYDS
jgi:hypothetical protein